MRRIFRYICLASVVAGCVLTGAGAPKKPVKKAASDRAELLQQARLAYTDYNLDRVDELVGELGDYEGTARLEKQAMTMRNMLDRVDDIVIVDSLNVDSALFFTHYRLSDEAGSLRANADGLPQFVPANGREIYDTADGLITLTGILDDGTPEQVRTISIGERTELPELGYPFMQADGTTLYLAMRDGDDGLGGWDIYMTRRDEECNFYEPTNMGMPYNSPANDYLLAVDEGTGLGWWATDRDAEPGRVTIYIFKPNATRTNLDSDSENLVARARVDSLEDSWPVGFDRVKALEVLNQRAHGAEGTATADFELSLGDGRVYTNLSQFTSSQAADEMADYLELYREMQSAEHELSYLRDLYSEGDLSVADQIRALEHGLVKLRASLIKQRNNVIKLER